ncbi:YheC/YheD family protein [Paenibacillus filicis]|uniref:YheC/YheD family protein n=1 Tax=Paenibacillus gyeongsangnamensis TaxID=3388067 RepID=A0ABT4QHQ0_9BACL|nr:YheC/YheD family protein [Paenibacillus filicis]MCZ8516406.1 YheC/YheD family protein [Paenibacillus filicis]
MFIQWISELKPDQIRLSKGFVDDLRTMPSSLRLHFGAWKKEVKVQISDLLPHSIIGLPKAFKHHFTMPALPYEIYLDGRNLHIGPVIALLVSNGKLTSGILKEYRRYLMNYEKIKGLIYVCSLHGINPGNQTVNGYFFNPGSEGEKQWEKGIFPYPGTVYRRIKVSKNSRYDHLITHIKRKIFNPYCVDKWELWNILSSDPLLKKHLPYTKKLNHLHDLNMMLDLYGSVYLKPAHGSMGKGISMVEKVSNGYLFKNRDKVKSLIKNKNQASVFLHRLKKRKRYLIQQPVTKTYHNRNVDFRVILQKDGRMNWTCSGIIARFGRSGRFYTNDVKSIGLAKDVLHNIFLLDEEAAASKEKEIITICSKACQTIEKIYGPSGDVGIDVVIDPDLKVWILEINSNHQHKMASYLKEDPHMYTRVMTRPLEFAKALAGFSEETIGKHAKMES